MKKKYFFIALGTFLYVKTGLAQEGNVNIKETAVQDAPKEDEEFVGHRVTMGETILMIARKYKVKPKDIYEYNPDATQGVAANTNLQIPLHRALNHNKAKIKKEGALYSNNAATADLPKD